MRPEDHTCPTCGHAEHAENGEHGWCRILTCDCPFDDETTDATRDLLAFLAEPNGRHRA